MNNIFGISQELEDIFYQIEENGGEITPELEERLAITEDKLHDKLDNLTTNKLIDILLPMRKKKDAEADDVSLRRDAIKNDLESGKIEDLTIEIEVEVQKQKENSPEQLVHTTPPFTGIPPDSTYSIAKDASKNKEYFVNKRGRVTCA